MSTSPTSSTSASSSSNLMRISGLVSGMDTDTMVQKLMQAERMPLDKLQQQQQKLTWQSDSYRQWNTDVFTFKSSTLLNAQLSSTFNTFNASSSNTDAISVTSTAAAVPGTYSFQVNSIAQSASLTGNAVFDPNQPLQSQMTNQGSPIFGQTDITINVYNDTSNQPKTSVITINAATEKIGDVVDSINNAKDANGNSLGLQAMYDTTLHQFIIKTKATGATSRVELVPPTNSGDPAILTKLGLGGTKDFVAKATTGASPGNPIFTGGTDTGAALGVNSTLTVKVFDSTTNTYRYNTISVSKTDTMKDVASKLNGLKDTNGNGLQLKATPDNTTSSFTLTSTGVNISQMELSASDPSLLTKLGLDQSSSNYTTKYMADGSDAVVNFNNTDLTFNSNNVTILGANYTLKSPTVDSTTGNSQASTITISRDLDTEVKNIEDFISKYNDMLDKLNTSISEPVYSDYPPLTSDQRSAMADTQIQQWEAKSKSGLLHNDDILSSLVNGIRSTMTSIVDTGNPNYNSLASIGISSHDYTDKGKLYVDETKLRAALQDDPDAVQKLFSASPDQPQSGTNPTDPSQIAYQTQQGLLVRLSDQFNTAFQQLTNKAGMAGNASDDQSLIGQMISDDNQRITDMQAQLNAKQTAYYQQFTQMEQAMSKYNSQSSWLTSQMSGSGGSGG